MTLQRADKPDWLDVDNVIVPTPFVSGWPLAYASGAVIATANVGIWPSLQFLFTPAGVDQRIRLRWVDDAAGTNILSSYVMDVRAGLPAAMVVRNRGPYVQIIVSSSAGGALSANLWVAGSSVTRQGNVLQGFPHVVVRNQVNVGSNIVSTTQATFAYSGLARIAAWSASTKWRAQVICSDVTGADSTIYDEKTAGQSLNGELFIPPLMCRLALTNNATTTQPMRAWLTPVTEG